MATFVTGGKTWILPKPEHDVASNATHPGHTPHANITGAPTPIAKQSSRAEEVKKFFSTFMAGTALIFFLYLIALLIALLGILLVELMSGPHTTVNSDGGITFPKPDGFNLTPRILTLAILPPVLLSLVMTFIEERTTFLNNDKGNTRSFICLAIIGSTLLTSAWFICNDIGLTINDTAILGNIQTWMNDRYGFEPYRVSELGQLVNGEQLYSKDPNFPAHDVYFKELNGAYFLVDVNGNELPVRN